MTALAELIEALRCLPGVGPKSAQRMAYHLLQHDRDGLAALATASKQALSHIQRCTHCNTFTEAEVCEICSHPERNATQLCVVETPADMLMVEQTMTFHGLYFVLMGHLSPLDKIGSKDIDVAKLMKRATDGVVREVILATNFTNEGEATAHYLSERLSAHGLIITRLARGVPVGSELEYVDMGTLARAVLDRRAT